MLSASVCVFVVVADIFLPADLQIAPLCVSGCQIIFTEGEKKFKPESVCVFALPLCVCVCFSLFFRTKTLSARSRRKLYSAAL